MASSNSSSAEGVRQNRIVQVRNLLRSWRWSIGDLISAFIVDEQSTKLRNGYRKSIADVVLDESILPILTNARSESVNSGLDGFISLNVLRQELRLLISHISIFGQHDDDINMEDFFDEDVGLQAAEIAPTVYQTWDSLTAPLRAGHDRESFTTRFITFCALLCFTIAPRLANHLPRTLGLYFQASGVRRRVLSVLHGLGLVEVYKTILKAREEVSKKAKVSYLNSSLLFLTVY